MSKIRERFITPPEQPLEVEPTGDLKPYVIFTQLKANGPFIYAGWLEAVDDAMAIAFAKEHYGQDQECVNVLAISREHITSSDGLFGTKADIKHRQTGVPESLNAAIHPLTPSLEGRGNYSVFTQKNPGDLWLSAGSVEAVSPSAAIDLARASIKQATNAHVVWVVESRHLLTPDRGDLIWRHTDQSYRLARGYGREVRAKWIAFRDEAQVKEYEKDDIAEGF